MEGDAVTSSSPGESVGAVEDWSARGFVERAPDPLRYAASTYVPFEATGMLCDRIPAGARVLDVGCGTGSITALVRDHCGADVVGIEPDRRRADACLARGLTVECGYYDAARADLLGRFDIIMFADVVEHVPDPASLLELASKHLTPGGRILVSTPNVAHWSVRASLLRGNFRYAESGIMDATHLRWFTIETIDSLFRSIGLSVVDHSWTSGSWLPFYWRRPWSLVPGRYRARLIRQLVERFPGLFACQHIVTAVPAVQR